ncbi:MAG: hypothetical protein ABGZ35_22395, partial [Planctomycetaceae bacterium]
ETELPTVEELSFFIGSRCREFGIQYDDIRTLVRLAECCLDCRMVSECIAVLAAVALRSGELTRKFVDRYSYNRRNLL